MFSIYDVHENMEALYRTFSNRIKPDVKLYLTLEGSVNSRNHFGGTSIKQVKKEIYKVGTEPTQLCKIHRTF